MNNTLVLIKNKLNDFSEFLKSICNDNENKQYIDDKINNLQDYEIFIFLFTMRDEIMEK